MRREDYLYVDKTAIITYFEGKKELFEGLAIAELETEWIVHRVLHLADVERSSHGWMDMVVKNQDYLILYTVDHRKLVKVGVDFDKETRNIGRWLLG